MDAIKTSTLRASFTLEESVCCSVGILLTADSTSVLGDSMVNIRRTDTISKTDNSISAGIKKNANSNSMRKAIQSKNGFFTLCKLVVKDFLQ